jgi:hypothetical protein
LIDPSKKFKNETNNNNNNNIMGKHPYYTSLSPFLTWANATPYWVPNNLLVMNEIG